jgi:hypothetical protein
MHLESSINLDVRVKLDKVDGTVKNPVFPHGASSKYKAILAIHPRSSGRGILAFSRKKFQMQGVRMPAWNRQVEE